jgi:hypothetical protein
VGNQEVVPRQLQEAARNHHQVLLLYFTPTNYLQQSEEAGLLFGKLWDGGGLYITFLPALKFVWMKLVKSCLSYSR